MVKFEKKSQKVIQIICSGLKEKKKKMLQFQEHKYRKKMRTVNNLSVTITQTGSVFHNCMKTLQLTIIR